jgi:hypothetical protein
MRVSALAPLVVLASACGEAPLDCFASCDKLFGNLAEQCAIVVPGRSAQEMTNDCVASCDHALARSGELGSYNPDERSSGADDISLENEQQAAAWMDCIHETSCDLLNQNYCAPTTNF